MIVNNILILNGPNLNLLGTREKEVYGTKTLGDINEIIKVEAEKMGVGVEFVQTNHEGEIIDLIHSAANEYKALILNAGAYTHYSYAIRDAIKAVGIPVIEAHMSNIHNREEFRSKSVIAPVCSGHISGFGIQSYLIALNAAVMFLNS